MGELNKKDIAKLIVSICTPVVSVIQIGPSVERL